MKDGKAEDDRHWWTGGACPPGCWQVVYLAIGVVRVPLWRSHKYSELSTVQCRVLPEEESQLQDQLGTCRYQPLYCLQQEGTGPVLGGQVDRWVSVGRCGQVWAGVGSCEQVWEGVGSCEQAWEGVGSCEQVWVVVSRWGKVWTGVVRCGQV